MRIIDQMKLRGYISRYWIIWFAIWLLVFAISIMSTILLPNIKFTFIETIWMQCIKYFDLFTVLTMTPFTIVFIITIVKHLSGSISGAATFKNMMFIKAIGPMVGGAGTTFGLINSTKAMENVNPEMISESQVGVFAGTSTALTSTFVGLSLAILAIVYVRCFVKDK